MENRNIRFAFRVLHIRSLPKVGIALRKSEKTRREKVVRAERPWLGLRTSTDHRSAGAERQGGFLISDVKSLHFFIHSLA